MKDDIVYLIKTIVDIDIICDVVEDKEEYFIVENAYRLYYQRDSNMAITGVLLAPYIQVGLDSVKDRIKIYKHSIATLTEKISQELLSEFTKAKTGIIITPGNSVIDNSKK